LFITPGTPRIVIISYSMNYGVQNVFGLHWEMWQQILFKHF